jgi:DNA-binding transcriptional LysR family regulator
MGPSRLSRNRPPLPNEAWAGLTPEALGVLVTFAHAGSIAAAAAELRWDPAQVSRRLAALERSLGRRGILLDRSSGKPAQLTEVGQQLVYRAEEMLGLLARAREEVHTLDAGSAERVRVGSLPSTSGSVLPALLKRYRARRPSIEVAVYSADSADNLHAVLTSARDIAIVHRLESQVIESDALVVQDLLVDRLLVAVPHDDRLARRTDPVQLADLKGRTWIQDTDSSFQRLLVDTCARLGYKPSFRLGVGSSLGWLGKQGFVATHQGLALIPRIAAAGCRQDIRLLELRPRLTRQLSVVTRRDPPEPVRAFVTCLITVCREFTDTSGGAG